MKIHPKVKEIILLFEGNELHAARSGRAVMNSLAAVVEESPAQDPQTLMDELDFNVNALLRVMPAYAPPLNVMHQVYSRLTPAGERMDSAEDGKAIIAELAASYSAWSEHARARIAQLGASIIPHGGTVFTFTLSETALRTMREAWNSGVEFKLLVTESRPNNDGLITARTLSGENMEVEIGIDANLDELIAKADLMFVGAEAILAEGSAICKVGTYPAALTAKANNVPVYVLVDTLKFHSSSLFGGKLWLDPIERDEIVGLELPSRAEVCGHLFDRTPAELISAIVTEKGLVHPEQASTLMLGMPIDQSIMARFERQKANPVL
jgi:translation initiation factor 2B subunit (eIF-2B alpha/beta/delta family)